MLFRSRAITIFPPPASTSPLSTGPSRKASAIGVESTTDDGDCVSKSGRIAQRERTLVDESDEAARIHFPCTTRTHVTERIRCSGIIAEGCAPPESRRLSRIACSTSVSVCSAESTSSVARYGGKVLGSQSRDRKYDHSCFALVAGMADLHVCGGS